jgi:hypothetical protein
MNVHFASALVALITALLMLIILAAAIRPQPWHMAPVADELRTSRFNAVVER